MTELALPTEGNALSVQMDYARAVASADMLPNSYRGKPANVLLAVGLGQSMGLSPAESLYRIAVIQGKPTASAELVAANVRRAGHRLRVVIEPGSATCSIWRADDPEFEFKVVRDAAWAKAMGLAENDNYKKQGDTMLSWRAITACARLACPDALYGVAYTPDEMYDMRPTSAPQWVDNGPLPQNSDAETSQAPSLPDSAGVEPGVDTSASESDLTDKTRKTMFALFGERGINEREQQLAGIAAVIGRELESRAELTEAEAQQVIESLRATA